MKALTSESSRTAPPATRLWKLPACGKLRFSTHPDLPTTLKIPASAPPPGISSPSTASTTTSYPRNNVYRKQESSLADAECCNPGGLHTVASPQHWQVDRETSSPTSGD